MIDNEKVRLCVAKGLSNYLSVPVIRANQNAEPPAYPYLSYTVITPESQNNGTWGKYEDGAYRKPTTQTWSISAQSDKESESVNLATKAREWLDFVGTLELNDNQIIVQSVSEVKNRGNVITTEYEYKNGFDVVFWLLSEITNTEATETIEEVGFNQL